MIATFTLAMLALLGYDKASYRVQRANAIQESERLLPEAQALAREMLRAAPGTLAAYKRVFDDGASNSFAGSLRLERKASLDNNSQVERREIDERLHASRRFAPGKPMV